MTTFHHISLGTLMPDGTTHILAWYVNDGTATRLRDALGKPNTEVNMDLEQSKEAFNGNEPFVNWQRIREHWGVWVLLGGLVLLGLACSTVVT